MAISFGAEIGLQVPGSEEVDRQASFLVGPDESFEIADRIELLIEDDSDAVERDRNLHSTYKKLGMEIDQLLSTGDFARAQENAKQRFEIQSRYVAKAKWPQKRFENYKEFIQRMTARDEQSKRLFSRCYSTIVLAVDQLSEKKYDRAFSLMKASTEVYFENFPANDFVASQILVSHSRCLAAKGDAKAALVNLEKALRIATECLHNDDPIIAATRVELARFYAQFDKDDKRGFQALSEAKPILESAKVLYPVDYCFCLFNLAVFNEARGNDAESEQAVREAKRFSGRMLGDSYVKSLQYTRYLAQSLERQGKFADAKIVAIEFMKNVKLCPDFDLSAKEGMAKLLRRLETRGN